MAKMVPLLPFTHRCSSVTIDLQDQQAKSQHYAMLAAMCSSRSDPDHLLALLVMLYSTDLMCTDPAPVYQCNNGAWQVAGMLAVYSDEALWTTHVLLTVRP